MTAPSFYDPEGLRLARQVVTNTAFLADLDLETRAELVTVALEILREDRDCRRPQPDPADPAGPAARVIRVPPALFQAGPGQRRIVPLRVRRRIAVHPAPTSPGDAA
ncbi:MAG: hypothetical protein ACK4TJ_00800 [Tabrizicola sp.]